MTIQERLRRSNIIMLVIPILIAGILLILGFGGAIVLLESIYLPRMGLTLHELHNMGEELEPMFQGLKACVLLYAAVVFVALLATVVFTNLYLTRGSSGSRTAIWIRPLPTKNRMNFVWPVTQWMPWQYA